MRTSRAYFIVLLCGTLLSGLWGFCRADECEDGSKYVDGWQPGDINPNDLDDFEVDPNNKLPRIIPHDLDVYTYGDSITISWVKPQWRNYDGYCHFSIIVQCAEDSSFRPVWDYRFLDRNTPDSDDYQCLATCVEFSSLVHGQKYYYRVVALANRIHGIDTIPTRAVPPHGDSKYDYVFSIQVQPDPSQGAHCFPNPFNPAIGEKTTIVVGYGTEASAIIRIYDMFGNLVRELGEEAKVAPGAYSWDGRNNQGQLGDIVANGGYMCIIDLGKDNRRPVKIAVRK